MIKEFTDEEIDCIVEYPLHTTPVVYFTRNQSTIEFITILSNELNKLT
jgi:hypothetical protein